MSEEKMEEPELEAEEEEKEKIEEIEQKSEEIPEKPEVKQLPEELQADKPQLCHELSVDQTTQTEPVPPEQPFAPSPVATEFSGLKPLSALEPQMSQFLGPSWLHVPSTPGVVYMCVWLMDSWLVVWNIFYFPIYIWNNHPN